MYFINLFGKQSLYRQIPRIQDSRKQSPQKYAIKYKIDIFTLNSIFFEQFIIIKYH
jgi:hypothetical protein